MVSLQFTHVPSLACRGRLRKFGADCSTVGLHCVTTTWQQILTRSLHLTVTGQAFCYMRLLNADILAGNAVWERLLIAVNQVYLYCVKSLRESSAMLPQVWKSFVSASVTSVPECETSLHIYTVFFSRSIKLLSLLEYVSTSLWE